MNGLDLFSGIGGVSLALAPWVRPVAYCENDRYAQAVLLSRMREGSLGVAPIFDDVRELCGFHIGAKIDIIYGGFPCQDISVAGTRKGLEGQRSGLFLHIIRLAKEIQPTFIFLENSPAIRTRGLVVVLRELSELGYDARWTVVSAEEVGAPHERKRWFLLAHLDRERLRKQQRGRSRKGWELAHWLGNDGEKKPLANSHGVRESSETKERNIPGYGIVDSSQDTFRSFWWATEPNVERVVHGLPYRMDRIRGLGNSVVPLQARTAFKRLMGLE